MGLLRYSTWFMIAGVLSPQNMSTAQDLRVLVLDALSGKPQADVKVEFFCVGPPCNSSVKLALSNDKGIATISYGCNDKQKLEISVFPPNKKEQCGDDVEITFNDAASAGFVSDPSTTGGIGEMQCPSKASKTQKPVPGQITMFAKKPTWWQFHFGG